MPDAGGVVHGCQVVGSIVVTPVEGLYRPCTVEHQKINSKKDPDPNKSKNKSASGWCGPVSPWKYCKQPEGGELMEPHSYWLTSSSQYLQTLFGNYLYWPRRWDRPSSPCRVDGATLVLTHQQLPVPANIVWKLFILVQEKGPPFFILASWWSHTPTDSPAAPSTCKHCFNIIYILAQEKGPPFFILESWWSHTHTGLPAAPSTCKHKC